MSLHFPKGPPIVCLYGHLVSLIIKVQPIPSQMRQPPEWPCPGWHHISQSSPFLTSTSGWLSWRAEGHMDPLLHHLIGFREEMKMVEDEKIYMLGADVDPHLLRITWPPTLIKENEDRRRPSKKIIKK